MPLADQPSGHTIQATSDEILMNCLCQSRAELPFKMNGFRISIRSNRVNCPSKNDNYRCPMVMLNHCMHLQAKVSDLKVSPFPPNFSPRFWRKILLIFVRETSPPAGTPRADPETTFAISYVFCRAHTCSRPGQRSKTDLLILDHGIATGPVNRATFQSAGPRAGLLKLETCTVSVGAFPD